MKLLKKLKSWWKGRTNYCQKLPAVTGGIYNTYYYPNTNTFEALCQGHTVMIKTKAQIVNYTNLLKAEILKSYNEVKK